MKLREILLLILLLILAPPRIGAARENLSEAYNVSFITMQQGLPHNFVEDLYRDSQGYVWISTSAALSRYDGYEFISFTPNSLTHHVKSSFVRDVTEDRFGRLWAVSDGGIDIINLSDLSIANPISSQSAESNPASLTSHSNRPSQASDSPASAQVAGKSGENRVKSHGKVSPIADKSGKFPSISCNPSNFVTTDSDGNIWIRNTTDIICITFDPNGDIEKILSLPHHLKMARTTAAVKALPDKFPGVFSAVDNAVGRLTIENGAIKFTPLSPALTWDPMIYVGDFATIDNKLWIATENGLFSYDTASGAVALHDTQSGPGRSLSQNFVNSLAISHKGQLLIGCLNGLNTLDPATGEITLVDTSEITGHPHNLNNCFINSLLAEGNNLWVGTEGSGINLFSPKGLHTHMFCHNPSDPSSISPNGVNAIHEDGDGTLWIGTMEGGLNRGIGGYEEGFCHFTRQSGALPHNSVSAITSDHTGHLWVGTWGGGLAMLNRLDPTRMLRHFTVSPEGTSMGYIGSLTFDPLNNYIWIGVNGGIYTYDLESETLSIPFTGADEVRGTVAAVIAPDGKLWMGGLDGLFAINLRGPHSKDGKGFEFVHYPCKLDNNSVMTPEKITSLAISRDASVWIGTNGNGLYRYNPKEKTFKNFNMADGLPNDVIHGIAEDLQGNIWVATYHGLGCITTDGRFLNYSKKTGLPTEQFFWNAYRRLANGNILFGSVDGLLAIEGFAPPATSPLPVHFTSLTVDNETVYGNPVSCRISEKDRSFEIGFSAFDYNTSGNGRYFYRMEGYENDWKELPPHRHSVAYMNLFPGTYNLEVKYVGQGQDFEQAPISRFEVEIVPNFYRRWWFILLIITAIIAAVAAIYSWRVNDLKRQRNNLKEAVDAGIREISEQKAQVQQLTADRITFFTNITHELRTPISLIIGPIERALKLSTNPKVIEQLNFVSRNSRYLLSLVNQLMDFRKFESGKMEPVTRKGDILKVIEEIIVPFRVYAMERGITIRTLYHFNDPVIPFNEDTLRKVLTNLIGNAIKFTPDNGTVTIYAGRGKTSGCEGPGAFYLCVSDTGCGIAEGESEKVFDHFYQGKDRLKYPLIGAADSGIGLYLCRKLVELYGGTISARNNRGAGCSFRVVIPIEESAAGAAQNPQPDNPCPGITDEEEGAADEKLRILIVEDNADMRAFMRSVLSDQYIVAEAEDGEQALKVLLSGQDIDLIISDLMMPRMDGLELIAKVRENFSLSHIPFIMLTAKTAHDARLEGYRKGIDAYILKPFDEEMLLARIKNLIASSRRKKSRFIDDMKVEHLEIEEESRDKKFADRVMEVLRDNYANSYFEVGEFAEALGVSRSLLNKKLQSLMGQSANQLMRTYRLKLAYELILKNRSTHNMNISEIAFQVGFNDSKYFTRCFTKQYGITPSYLMKEDDSAPRADEETE